MAAPDFPASPTVGQIYTAPSSGIVYKWDGAVWGTAGVPQGAYWTDTGTTLTPTNATRTVTIPGSSNYSTLIEGSGASPRGRFSTRLDGATLLSLNRDFSAANAQDDATKSSWGLQFVTGAGGDQFYVQRSPAGSTTQASLMTLDATGQLTVPGPAASAADNATIVMGSRTQKGRLQSLPGLDWVGMTINQWYNGSAWVRDDAAQPAWQFVIAPTATTLAVTNAAGTTTTPFVVQGSDGKTVCTLADGSVVKGMLAAGATLWSGSAAIIPASFSTGAAAWTTVASVVVAVRASGCPVLLLNSASLRYVGSQTANTIYIGWMRDGGLLIQSRCDFSAPVAGFSTWPLPPITHYDNGASAGNHTYALAIYVANTQGTVSSQADSTGQISAWSFS